MLTDPVTAIKGVGPKRALLFQKLLGLGALEFGMIVQVFILMTISPIILDFLTRLFMRTQRWFLARRKQREVRR